MTAHSHEKSNPFSETELTHIFRLRENRLITRESTKIELKESFNWAKKYEYAKAIGAFTNNQGGYIIFGIKNSPREIVGMTNNRFEEIDEAHISHFLNECFSCEIKWTKEVHEINGKNIGLFYVYEADEKPVIFRKNNGSDGMREGDIYFRYRGINERIKYTELKKILDREKEKYTKSLFDHLSKIIQIGSGNVAIIDTLSGMIHGKNTTAFIDEALIPQLKIVTEGSFDSKKGEPVYRYAGNIEPARIFTRRMNIAIRTKDILNAFLEQSIPDGIEPVKYIEQIPYESSWYLPIYFFIEKSGLSKEEIIELINDSESKMQTKGELLDRLRKDEEDFTLTRLESNTLRQKFKSQLLEQNIDFDVIDESNLLRLLEAITHLDKSETTVVKEYVLDLLKKIIDKYYATYKYSYSIRKAICHVDYTLHSS
nr:ATP-binding protein [uncultured Methanolobus sp.]